MMAQMDKGSINDLITYRLQRAKATLMEADYNGAGGYFNAAVNRLYYSCYYAASALMLANNIEASTHKGIKTMIGLQFVKTGRFDARFGRTSNFLKIDNRATTKTSCIATWNYFRNCALRPKPLLTNLHC